MATATITSKGQVTIPKDVRERLRLRQGDRVEFVVEDDGSVRLRPIKVDLRDLFGMIESDRHVTVEEMNAAVRERGGRLPPR
jgi:AbrB family looped-hinge helix DNA binding protein